MSSALLNMIQLIPITHSTVLNIDFKQIYEEAFPMDERREWNQLSELLANPQFSFNGIYDEQKLIGLISVWNLNKFSFIEHFAIRGSERGKGFGSQVLQLIRSRISNPVILEVEEPFNDTSRKRIAFYECQNFLVSDCEYYQPPYSIGKSKVKMLLMSFPERIKPKDFINIKSQIYQSVYQYQD